MTPKMREKVERARHFALALENRNYTGNLSAGWLVEKGDEIANLAQAFQALDEVMGEIRDRLNRSADW